MFYINTSYLFMNLILIFSIRSFCFDTTRLVQVYIRMRRLDSLGWFPQHWRIFSRGWNASLNCFVKKRKKKKKKKVCSFGPEQVPQTDVVDDAGSLLIYPKAAWKHQPLVNCSLFIPFLFFPTLLWFLMQISVQLKQKKTKAKAVKAYVAVGLVQG